MKRLLAALAVILSLLSIPLSISLFQEAAPLPALLALLILFTALFALSGLLYFFRSLGLPENAKNPKSFPPVAVAVLSYNERKEDLRKTLRSLKQMKWNGPLHFYLLDDSRDPSLVKSLEKMCKEEKVTLVHRKGREGYKAGALNEFFSFANEEFIAVFDADEVLANPDFLMDTMGHFEDRKIAYVQTSKHTSAKTPFQQAADETNATFFNVVAPVNAAKGFPMFLGSCAVIRRSSWERAKFPHVLVEDVGFSFSVLQHGMKGAYVKKFYCTGRPVGTFTAFRSQHSRYIYGATQLIFSYLSKITRIPLREQPFYLVQLFGLHVLSTAQFLLSAAIFLSFLSPPSAPLLQGAVYATLFPLLTVIVMGLLKDISPRVSLTAYFLNFSLILPRMFSSLRALLGLRFSPLTTSEGEKSVAPGILRNNLAELVLALLFLFLVPLHTGISQLVLLWWALLYSSPAIIQLIKS